MLKITVAFFVIYALMLNAANIEAKQSLKSLLQEGTSVTASSLLRSDQSELAKLQGQWEVETVYASGSQVSYFNLTEISIDVDGDYMLTGTIGGTNYASGDPAYCWLSTVGFNFTYEDYVCVSLFSEGVYDAYNWYFIDLIGSEDLAGVYAISAEELIEETYNEGKQIYAIYGSKESSTTSGELLSSNLTTLKNTLLSTKTYAVSGSFSPYDFAGVESAFDWTFVTPNSKVYQLQGNAPSANDVFGWKEVEVIPGTPAWYMSYLGDWDSDGNGKYDWVLVGNGFDAVYKLEGVTAAGNFAYSTKIDVDYSVSSDKKSITFGLSSSSDGIIGSSGGNITLPGGESAVIPAGSTAVSTTVDFKTANLSAEVGEEMQSYLFASNKELKSVNFSIPVTLSGVSSVDDLHAVYIREDGKMKSLTLQYDSTKKIATFELKNNWTFTALSPAGRALDADNQKNKVIVMKKQSDTPMSTKSKLIEMPYYEQPGNSCWATTGKMLTHGLPEASQAATETSTIFSLMGALNIGINDGFNGFFKAASLAKVLGNLQYKNYFLWSSARNKMIKELDLGHPLIYMGTFKSTSSSDKITHAVLILGYEYDTQGNLSFIMHDPRNTSGKSMYTKTLWKDMQLVEYLPTEAVTLIWSNTAPPKTNSKFTVGIPSNGELGRFYFEGQKTDAYNAIRYYLQFTPSLSRGYIWSQSATTAEVKTTFQENVDELVLQLPVYNSASTSGSAFVIVEVYEKADSSNKVSDDVTVSVAAHAQETINLSVDLKPLLDKLDNPSDCVVSLRLSENSKVSTWHVFDQFQLTPPKSVSGCSMRYDSELDGSYKDYEYSVKLDEGYVKCSYYESGELHGEMPYASASTSRTYDGVVKWYYKSGQVATEVLYINGRKDGLEKWYYESGQLKYEVPYVDGKRNGAAKWYSESGVITSLTPYVDDKIDGVLINYDMGYCTLYENDSMVDDDYPCP